MCPPQQLCVALNSGALPGRRPGTAYGYGVAWVSDKVKAEPMARGEPKFPRRPTDTS